MDYHWASQQQPPSRALSHSTTAAPTTYRERVTTSLPLEEYSLTNFFAYAVYPALYIAGPIMSFNDFSHQLRHPTPPSRRALLSYAARFAACLLTMELVLHYMYVVAIKDSGAWQGDTPAQLCMIGFWNLIVVWLKVSPLPPRL
jgi:D-alanyl-lipoteichoic acid acyltransferase DltB (MBOAT superfamily)